VKQRNGPGTQAREEGKKLFWEERDIGKGAGGQTSRKTGPENAANRKKEAQKKGGEEINSGTKNGIMSDVAKSQGRSVMKNRSPRVETDLRKVCKGSKEHTETT